jgi:hypothetical protein
MIPVQEALKELIAILSCIPSTLVPPKHIGFIWPRTDNDLPAIVLTMREIVEQPVGIGKLVGMVREEPDGFTEISGIKVKGIFQLAVLATSPENVDEMSWAAADCISKKMEAADVKGFLEISPESIGEIMPRVFKPSGYQFWERIMEYRGTFEGIDLITPPQGGVIKEIQTTIDEGFHEKFIIKK